MKLTLFERQAFIEGYIILYPDLMRGCDKDLCVAELHNYTPQMVCLEFDIDASQFNDTMKAGVTELAKINVFGPPVVRITSLHLIIEE